MITFVLYIYVCVNNVYKLWLVHNRFEKSVYIILMELPMMYLVNRFWLSVSYPVKKNIDWEHKGYEYTGKNAEKIYSKFVICEAEGHGQFTLDLGGIELLRWTQPTWDAFSEKNINCSA